MTALDPSTPTPAEPEAATIARVTAVFGRVVLVDDGTYPRPKPALLRELATARRAAGWRPA